MTQAWRRYDTPGLAQRKHSFYTRVGHGSVQPSTTSAVTSLVCPGYFCGICYRYKLLIYTQWHGI